MGTRMIVNPVALTIASSDSSGGAGIQADLKAFASVGVHGSCVIVAITAQNISEGVSSIHELPLAIIEAQFDAVINEFKIGAIKTGMLYSPEVVELISTKLQVYRSANNIPLIVDPVLVATTGKDLAKGTQYIDAIKKYLIPQATILMPNLHEAGELLERDVMSFDDMELACTELAKGLGCENVLLKGGHAYTDSHSKTLTKDAVDILYRNSNGIPDRDRFSNFSAPRFPNDYHGSGCTFSSLITAYMVKGSELELAIGQAKRKITELIGSGYLLTVPGESKNAIELEDFAEADSDRNQVLEKLNDGIIKLKQMLSPNVIPIIMPEVGINFGYAIPLAITKKDICALEGRLVRLGESRVAIPGTLTFGASQHVAAIILAAMKFDKNFRSVMNIKYRKKVIKAVFKAGLSAGSFDRTEEPDDVSTMEWGTEKVVKELGKVPDVIYDEGGIGKEPMVRIFGHNPQDVLNKLERIIEQL
jgi:hydroxymethylpyrimidine/phosphomethylpyrimidine kinase